jgi:8-oxo-dGTP pyrophosphatase MutT (NUDIX family)
MAFPGGRRQPEDADVRATAERETLEEVGLPLAGAARLGRLDDLQGRHQGRTLPLVISAFVYGVPGEVALRLSHEVREALWVPLPTLLERERHVEHRYPPPGGPFRFPGILVGEPDRHVVWGLTYRFLEVLFEALGRPFPDRW